MSELPVGTQNALANGRNGISATQGGGFIADTPDSIALVRLMTVKSGLKFEIATGIKASRVSILKVANSMLGTSYRTKKQALNHIDALLEQVYADARAHQATQESSS